MVSRAGDAGAEQHDCGSRVQASCMTAPAGHCAGTCSCSKRSVALPLLQACCRQLTCCRAGRKRGCLGSSIFMRGWTSRFAVGYFTASGFTRFKGMKVTRPTGTQLMCSQMWLEDMDRLSWTAGCWQAGVFAQPAACTQCTKTCSAPRLCKCKVQNRAATAHTTWQQLPAGQLTFAPLIEVPQHFGSSGVRVHHHVEQRVACRSQSVSARGRWCWLGAGPVVERAACLTQLMHVLPRGS